MRKILLITSTIAPSAKTALLAHRDPRKRLDEYKIAFSFYLKLLRDDVVDKIIYADNSGHDLSELEQLANGYPSPSKIEFISFNSPAQPDVNRYFLEIGLIREALKRSTDIKADDQIWKVTGRYLVPNVSQIIRGAPQNADVYINCRNRPIHTVDFYLVRFNQFGFEKLLASDMSDFETIASGEDVLRLRLDRHTTGPVHVVPRFRQTPKIVGTRGFDGANYDSFSGNMKFLARRVLNRLAPNFWI